MNALNTVREIGINQTCINIAKVKGSTEIVEKVGAYMPLPSKNCESNVNKMTGWLSKLGKSKWMFLTPEIAFFDPILKEDINADILIVVPSDMDEESKERLSENLPGNLNVKLLKEPDFPQEFYPSNGVIVVCGYKAQGRLMVLPETYRMIEHYSSFLGKKVFLAYTTLKNYPIYPEWIEINSEGFSMVWEEEL